MMKKISWFWLVGLVVSLYTTFVVQNLWNWFVVPTFYASSISFWGMFGLLLLVSLLGGRGEEFAAEQRWKSVITVLDACIPEGKRETLEEALDQQAEGVWVEVGLKIFERLLGSTLTLVIGWGIHAFLA